MKKEDLRPCMYSYTHAGSKSFEGLFHRWYESKNDEGENILYAVVEVAGAVNTLDMRMTNFRFTD
ncbi:MULTISPECIES: hypothetical protein [Flavobacteriaceae]|uniref:hypothetical protein n=1 Tax=Flavobacteriaceae TaxID=49546 RepID=UPI001490EAEE|nr:MULTISPECIES: hypothetical protein [Allomuricauda]MDC6364821.1 hypothetical protein [Muricauda sp. AC10]